MTTYRTGTHHGITINREGDGHHCGREDHDCTRGHIVAVVVNGDQALAERICTLLNGDQVAGRECAEETPSWDHFTPEQLDSYWIRCTLSGPHDEHKDENTGLTWRTARHGDAPSARASLPVSASTAPVVPAPTMDGLSASEAGQNLGENLRRADASRYEALTDSHATGR